MYDNLIRRNPVDSGRTIIPDLAHSWEIAPDNKTYTFFLRQGVTFHDGAPLTADDVKATYARIIWPPQGFSSPRTPLFSAVRAINVRDAQTIEFTLREPRPPDFMLGAFASGWNIIVCKQTLEENNYNLRHVMHFPGTGPFRHKPTASPAKNSLVYFISIAYIGHPVWRSPPEEAKRGPPSGPRIPRNEGAMMSLLLPSATTGVSLIAGWCVIGATPRGQPRTPALMLPHGCEGCACGG